MKKAGAVLLLGIVLVLIGWWFISGGSAAQPSEGVVDVWVTWGDKSDQLQALFDRFSRASGIPVRVESRTGSDDLLEALDGAEPPDLVILSSNDLIGAFNSQGLVEPLDRWVEATGIDLGDIYPAPLAQCRGRDGAHLCLPWGCDIDALFWNKDLFHAAGLDPEQPPQTMEEMVEYADRLTIGDETGGLEQVGFIPDLSRSHTQLYARMFGGAFFGDEGARLAVNSKPVIDALNWQRQFNSRPSPEELKSFVSSFTPYMTSRHALHAGRRMSCQQCHRASPIQNGKTPDAGFLEGRVAMMIDGEWLAGLNARSQGLSRVNLGVAPAPPPAAHPERANTTVVQGPVVFIPAGAMDKEMAADLLAWMMSPEIVAEEAQATASLPTSRRAAQDPRFDQVPFFELFMDLLAHPNASPAATTPITLELNEALVQVEEGILKQAIDAKLLLNEVQTEFALKLEQALSHDGTP